MWVNYIIQKLKYFLKIDLQRSLLLNMLQVLHRRTFMLFKSNEILDNISGVFSITYTQQDSTS